MNASLRETLAALSIDPGRAPEIWRTNWDKAMAACPGGRAEPVFLSDDYLARTIALLKLSGGQTRAICDTVRLINASEAMRRLIWIWFYSQFEGDMSNQFCDTENWPVPPALPDPLRGVFRAVIAVGAIPSMRRFYAEKGVPEEIFLDTLTDVGINMDEYFETHGHFGLGAFHFDWMQFHFKGRMFKLGRLQFMHAKYGGKYGGDAKLYQNRATGEYRIIGAAENIEAAQKPEWELLLQKNDPILEVHIPRGGGLTPGECRSSYEYARAFYRKYFPELRFKGFTCGSWLMSPALKTLLPPTSNIIKFQNEYIILNLLDSEDYFEYVFGGSMKARPAADLPEDTSLRRAVKKHLLAGGHIYGAEGVML